MFLHIGNGESVRKRDIIGIFDMDTATASPITRKTLNEYEKKKKVSYSGEEIPRSFLLLGKKEGEIRLSLISSHGLKMRADQGIAATE